MFMNKVSIINFWQYVVVPYTVCSDAGIVVGQESFNISIKVNLEKKITLPSAVWKQTRVLMTFSPTSDRPWDLMYTKYL